MRALPAPAGAALLLAVVAVLYRGTLRHPLVFDDATLTEEFLRGYGAAWFRLDLRWFAYASFGWTYDWFGPDLLWLRLGNVLLHGATTAAMFLLIDRLLRAAMPLQDPAPRARWIALLCAAAFALHPVAVYGAAYLMQRTILMATFFSLLSLALFLEGLLRGQRRWYYAAAAAYFVAVFSKEHCVMLPAVAAALAVTVRGPSLRLARELAVPGALFAAIAVLVLLKHRGLLGIPYEPFAQAAIAQLAESRPGPVAAATAAAAVAAAPAGENLYAASIVNQGYLFFRYLLLWALPWPGWMSVDMRPAFPAHWWAWPQFAGFLLWAAWPLFAGWLLQQRGLRGLAGLALLAPWLFGLTEFVTVRIQEPFVLYRSYLWMSLLPLLPAAVLARAPLRPGLAILGVACIAYVPAAVDRIGSFSTELGLWEDAVRKADDPAAPLAERPLRHRGIAQYRVQRYADALADFERALQMNARSADNWMTRGTLYMRTARSAEALADFDRALALEPDHYDALGRRCVVLMRLKRLDEALANCQRAAKLAPYSAENLTSLGMVLALQRDAKAAEAQYRRALQLAPSNADAHYQYGVLLAGTGRAEAAREHFRRACAGANRAACSRL